MLADHGEHLRHRQHHDQHDHGGDEHLTQRKRRATRSAKGMRIIRYSINHQGDDGAFDVVVRAGLEGDRDRAIDDVETRCRTVSPVSAPSSLTQPHAVGVRGRHNAARMRIDLEVADRDPHGKRVGMRVTGFPNRSIPW